MATKQIQYQDRIIVDPRILAGKPVIKGTRIPVELVLERLAEDFDTRLLFEDYPRLTEEDVKACLLFYKAVLAKEGRKHVRADQPQRADRRNVSVQDALSLAGAWADLPSDQMEEELDRIRHQSTPTPPIDLDL